VSPHLRIEPLRLREGPQRRAFSLRGFLGEHFVSRQRGTCFASTASAGPAGARFAPSVPRGPGSRHQPIGGARSSALSVGGSLTLPPNLRRGVSSGPTWKRSLSPAACAPADESCGDARSRGSRGSRRSHSWPSDGQRRRGVAPWSVPGAIVRSATGERWKRSPRRGRCAAGSVRKGSWCGALSANASSAPGSVGPLRATEQRLWSVERRSRLAR
jgi:hypothetical protein